MPAKALCEQNFQTGGKVRCRQWEACWLV